MCGISGLVTHAPVALPTLEAMSLAIRHRGPHQCGTWSDQQAGVHLAHRRLSIIDLSDLGRQPMASACGRFLIVFNGEIFNYVELRRELASQGCVFRTQSDTEVLLQAYATWGAQCLQRLNGMFAFALYDVLRHVLFVARDRLGEKPFYYIDRPGLFAFASEVKAFRPLAALGVSLDLDPEAVDALLGHMWVPGRDRTLLQGVRRLEPGSWGEYDLDARRFCTGSYWTLRVRDQCAKLSFDEAVETADHLLNESVRLRLRADVPVEVMLSGGIDSSVIAAIASRHVSDLRTYTLTFDHPATEGRFAQRVAQHIGSRHQELFVATGDMLEAVKAAIPCFDDLTTLDGGLVTTCALSRLVSEQGIRVLLLGEGSDEVNAGYSRFLFAKAPFTWLPAMVRSAAYYHSINAVPAVAAWLLATRTDARSGSPWRRR